MIDDRFKANQTLHRIAEALGTDATAFSSGQGRPQAGHEALELLIAFDRIVDPEDRRACLDFVRAVAERQPRT